MRLIVGNKTEGRTSVNLPFSWNESQWPEAMQFIKVGADTYKQNNGLKTKGKQGSATNSMTTDLQEIEANIYQNN